MTPLAELARRIGRLPLAMLLPVALFLAVAVLAPWLAPYDPAAQSYANILDGPSWQHWLGTDYLGRDMLSRIVVAARVSLVAMATVLIAALAIGVVVGSVAGYVGGAVELALISVVDILLALPSLIIALALIGVLGAGYGSMVAALTLAWWANYARMSRAAVAAEIHKPYIAAVRVLGASHLWIFTRHVLPSVLGLVVVYASADAGALVLAIATLSFLGLGVEPPTPEWGQMLVDGLNYFEDAPRLVLFPGVALTLVVLGFNLVGEAFALQKVPRPLKGWRLRRRVARRAREAGALRAPAE